ncbi:MAG: hypothetical protein IT483_10420 [Gammaproteobacteria bacterium]|mgnify:CR=1 FL=1|nr:hypothetical protein [Gammaproteobacteria bacterium]
MNRMLKSALAAAVMLPTVAFAADAPPSAACYDIKYSIEFLNQFPMAPAICQGVVENNGVKYARLTAAVTGKEGKTVSLGFKNVFGTQILELDFEPADGSKLTMDGKSVFWKDVKPGDTVSLYLPERSLGVVDRPNTDGVSTPIQFRSKARK